MLHDSTNSKNQKHKVFMFSQLTASDDDASVGDDTRSTLLTPTALEAHAEETRREVNTHRERMKQRSVAHIEAQRHRSIEESELQRTVAKLMRELALAQESTQIELTKRVQIEKSYRSLQAEHRSVVDELAALKRKDAFQGSASPITSPSSRLPGAFPSGRDGAPKPSVSFRLVKKSAAPSQQHTTVALTNSEAHARDAIADYARFHLRTLHQCWVMFRRSHVEGLATYLRDVELLEGSERNALAAHEAKLRYKALVRLKSQAADELYRKVAQQRSLLVNQSKVDAARKLEDEMEDSFLHHVVVAPPLPTVPKNPPWYPAGHSSSVNYHSPHRQRSPSATSRSVTPSRLGSAGQSLTSMPNYSHIPPKVSTRDRSVSPGSSRSMWRHSNAHNEPSPNMSPPTPHHHPTSDRRSSPQLHPVRYNSPPKHDAHDVLPASQKHHDANKKITSVKKTIDTMEALLAELQSWKSSAHRP